MNRNFRREKTTFPIKKTLFPFSFVQRLSHAKQTITAGYVGMWLLCRKNRIDRFIIWIDAIWRCCGFSCISFTLRRLIWMCGFDMLNVCKVLTWYVLIIALYKYRNSLVRDGIMSLFSVLRVQIKTNTSTLIILKWKLLPFEMNEHRSHSNTTEEQIDFFVHF